MPEPLHTELLFPTAGPDQASLSQVLSSLRRANLTVQNRLRSIREDAHFVNARVAEAYRRPLVANERCGSWYVEPGRKRGSAYFKSTDGHERAWKFSTRRLNLQVLGLVEENDGIIIVDSTRRGKRMPDALSTTIPIWCAVLNRVLFPASDPRSQHLFLPPHLPPTTHAQVAALLPSFVDSLRALGLEALRPGVGVLSKPLRPFWVTRDSRLFGDDDEEEEEEDKVGKEGEEEGGKPPPIFQDYRPIICCTASRRVQGSTEIDEGGYIQGAADDTENWAHGLLPSIFWQHADQLLHTPEVELPDLIARLVEDYESQRREGSVVMTRLTPELSVCALPLEGDTLSSRCYISLTPDVSPKDSWVKSPNAMDVGVGKSKTASRSLRLALPDICVFASRYLASEASQGKPQIVVACQSGKDLSVGVALAISCFLFDDDGNPRKAEEETNFSKTMVKVRLGRIMTAYPEANPSRSTLQSVNSFLMDWHR